MAITASTPILTSSEVRQAIDRFLGWLDADGYASYDPYDIWGTRYGLWARKIYYRRRAIGTALVAPLVLADIVAPGIRRLFVRKARFATADGQLVLAFLNLYAVTGEKRFLTRAVALGDEISGYAVPGYHGPCWGYPFDWENGRAGTWKRNTPYITCTPYCYEAFLHLHEATGDDRYLALLRGIAEFVHHDLKDTPHSESASAGSYSPYDDSKVVNASAYRAWLLIDAGRRFGRSDYVATGTRNLNFVLETQRDDGAWLYALGTKSPFIDNFHTCFNLKNLAKINRLLRREDIEKSIARGYAYYRAHLLNASGDPKSFAMEPRLQVATLEMYNFAEGITLGVLLGDSLPEARSVCHTLASRLVRDFQVSRGHFVTRVFRFGIRHTFPFLRWPQAQLFLSLTNLLRSLSNEPVTRPEHELASASLHR